MIHEQGRIDEAVAADGPEAERLSKWAAVKAVAKVTPKPTWVANVIVMWAAAMLEEG